MASKTRFAEGTTAAGGGIMTVRKRTTKPRARRLPHPVAFTGVTWDRYGREAMSGVLTDGVEHYYIGQLDPCLQCDGECQGDHVQPISEDNRAGLKKHPYYISDLIDAHRGAK